MPPQTSIIVDIETIPDTALLARCGVELKKDAFAPLLFHAPVAIAVGTLDGEGKLLSVESLGAGVLLGDEPEALTEAFWHEVNHAAQLITFNGKAFDLPVMVHCSLAYGCAAPNYWAARGMHERYSDKHLDLFEKLAPWGGKGYTLGNWMSRLGYQGKDGMDGSMVEQAWKEGRINEIRSYNRRDVISTYALWLHWARISGRLMEAQYRTALTSAKPFLDQIR